jgi:PPE-repeat protein
VLFVTGDQKSRPKEVQPWRWTRELVEQIPTAMYGYAGASAAATTLTPFSAPTQNTNPAGTGTQAAAVASAGTGTPSALSQLLP